MQNPPQKSLFQRYPLLFRILAPGIFLIVAFVLLCVHPIIGIADNGDFQRLTWPAGLEHSKVNYDDKFFNYVDPAYEVLASPAPFETRLEKALDPFWSGSLFVGAAVLIHKTLTDSPKFELWLLGLVYFIPFFAGLLAVRRYCLARFKGWPRLALEFVAILILGDASYLAYFNSFYGEAAALVFFVAAVACMGAILRVRRMTGRTAALLALFSAGLITAKPQYFSAAPFLAAAFILLIWRYGAQLAWRRWAYAAALLAVPIAWLQVGKGADDANVFNQVFQDLLYNSPDRAADMRDLGLNAQALRPYIGKSWWGLKPGESSVLQREFFPHVRRATVIGFYLTHPSRLYSLTRDALHDMFSGLPMGELEAAPGIKPVSKTHVWRLWSLLRESLAGVALWVVLAGFGLALYASRMMWKRTPSPRTSAVPALHLLLLLFMISQLLLGILGEGRVDISKHLFMFGFAGEFLLLWNAAFLLELFAPASVETVEESRESERAYMTASASAAAFTTRTSRNPKRHGQRRTLHESSLPSAVAVEVAPPHIEPDEPESPAIDQSNGPTSRIWRMLPQVLAFVLLAWQVALPWLSTHFPTQDGPAHVYSSSVVRSLLFDSHSPYAGLYRIGWRVLPNWTTTFLLAALTGIFGVDHAEQVLASGMMLAGFFAFAYARRVLSPRSSPWSPLNNFRLQTWFLWMGFYNFYLGMAGALFCTAYFLRHGPRLSWKHAGILSALISVLFFTHLAPVCLAIMAVTVSSAWLLFVAPMLVHRSKAPSLPSVIREGLSPFLVTVATVIPALLLLADYLSQQPGGAALGSPDAWNALKQFPQHLFWIGPGTSGHQSFLYPFVILLMIAGLLSIRRRDLISARGAVLAVALCTLGLYLFVPDEGWGGGYIKIRFAWAVFLFGCLFACSQERLRALRVPVSIFIAVCMIPILVNSGSYVVTASRAIDQYISVFQNIKPGSKLVRMRFEPTQTREKLGLTGVSPDPLMHVTGYAAARRYAADLSDYEAHHKIHPLVNGPMLTPSQSWNLYLLEVCWDKNPEDLMRFLHSLPVKLDYIAVFGDDPSLGGDKANLVKMRSLLDAEMKPAASAGNPPFLTLFERK